VRRWGGGRRRGRKGERGGGRYDCKGGGGGWGVGRKGVRSVGGKERGRLGKGGRGKRVELLINCGGAFNRGGGQ